MELTRKLDNIFSNISEFLYELMGEHIPGRWLGYSICMIFVGIYIIILYSEFFFGLMFRHRIKMKEGEWGEHQFSNEEKEWLNKIIGRSYWKSMILDFSADDWWLVNKMPNEIRFLRKKDALAYKMVWG